MVRLPVQERSFSDRGYAAMRWLGLALIAAGMAAGMAACGGGDSAGLEAAGPASRLGIEVTPAHAVAFADSGRLLTIKLMRSAGDTGDVVVALDNPPAGVSAEALTFTAGISTLTMEVALDESVAPGELALAVKASGSSGSAFATAHLAVEAAQPRTQQKIEAARMAGGIDSDTALLYRLYALTGDPRLPQAYVGSGSAEEDLRLFGLIEQAWPQLSAATQAAMQPFLFRPDHPDSIYRRAGTSARARALGVGPGQRRLAAAPPPPECLAGAQWRSVRSATIPVRIWSECYADADLTLWTSDKAEAALAVFEKVWAPMTRMMGPARSDGAAADNGGDDAFDVYMVSSYSVTREGEAISAAEVGTANGYAQSALPCAMNGSGNRVCSGYMVLPGRLAGTSKQRSTIIHELFHVFQFAHNESLKEVEDWFYEASARWVESHYDRTLAWPEKVALSKVHKPWFKTFLKADTALDSTTAKHPYASYIWPFFLEQETGGTDVIGRIWLGLESAKTLEDENRIVDAAYEFDANFHRFALRNVNEELLPGDPVRKRYVHLAGSGQFPECPEQKCDFKPKYLTSMLTAGAEDRRAYRIEPMSAKYAQFMVSGDALPNRVEFDFSGLNNRGSLKVDALVLTSSTPKDEWVGEPIVLNPDSKGIFCFELGRSTATVRGEFKEVRLVLSNSSRDTGISGDVVVRPTSRPCGVWEGSVESTSTAEIDVPGVQHITTTITSTSQLAFEFDEENSSGASRAFRVRAGSYVYRVVYDVTGVKPCRTVQTASGPIHLPASPLDFSDGATYGTMATFVEDGTPRYVTPDGVGGFATLTQVSTCTSSGREETSILPMSPTLLWKPEQQVFDLKQNASVMQESISVTRGPSTIASKWLLTKKSE